jgi:uncharacterized protein (DUF305 family)
VKNRGWIIAVVAVLLVAAVTVFAVVRDGGGMDHGGMTSASGDTGGGHAMSGTMDERAFIEMMIPHHQSAIDMARTELRRGTNAQAKAIAQDIVDAQDREIAQMRAWYRDWYGTDVPAVDTTQMGMDMSHHMDAIAEGGEPDRAFLAAMIPHHASAITMADGVLAGDPRMEIAGLARQIIADQSREIGAMQALRQRIAPPIG